MNSTNTNPQENPITEFYDTITSRPDPVSSGIRFLNFLIDYVILLVIDVLVIIFLNYGEDYGSRPTTLETRLIFLLLFLVYYFICEWTMGRTIGKIITGTKVVTVNDDKPTVGIILKRTLSRIVPFEPFSFLGNPVGWHDRWTDTVVTKVSK